MTVSSGPATGLAPERTKARLLELIGRYGAQTAQDLAARLEVSVPAARRHLCDLQAQGLLQARTERPGGRGRPQHVFVLTERGEATFPRTYSGLCVDLLRHLESLYGKGAVLRVLQSRSAEVAESLRPHLSPHPELSGRLGALAAQLSSLGFDAVVYEEDGEWVLEQRNCPNLTVARHYQELCAAELHMYADLLDAVSDVPEGMGSPGEQPTLTRRSRIACGQGSCRYHLSSGAPARS